MRIIVTGSRLLHPWDVARRIEAYLETHYAGVEVTLIHGDAPGADQGAVLIAGRSHLVHAEAHPARWVEFGKSAGPIRNMAMAALGAQVCLAFVHPSLPSVGTRDMVATAKREGIDVVML